MAYLFQPNYVQYVCSCGSLKPISKIYLCRRCMKIRCGYCVCHEVDSHYCSNCMENLPSTEVRMKKNKCSNCYDCPCCFQTLSTRAVAAPIRTPAGAVEDVKDLKAQPKKVYYLLCSFCRWSSRDAGIPDQQTATGGWPEQENPHATRINNLIEYHKILASREKQQKDKKSFNPKRIFLQFESFGLSSSAIKKSLGRQSSTQAEQSNRPTEPTASEEVEGLPSSIFTEQLDITKLTLLEQRLQHPEVQAEQLTDLRPQRKQFLLKRSQRCRTCEHNVIKPEMNPLSTRFKLQLSAYYHVPEVRIVTCEPLRAGKPSELLLKLCNPTQHETKILLLPLDTPTTPVIPEPVELKLDQGVEQSEVANSPNLMPSAVRQAAVTEDPKPISVSPNADVALPSSSLILPPRDDTAEYDDTNENHNIQDDPKLVVWRKANKAVIRLQVTPQVTDSNANGENVVAGFVLQHAYVNTLHVQKSSQTLDLRVKLFLNIGKLVGSD